MMSPVFKALCLASALFACAGSARAAVELQTLVDRSPFAPAGLSPDATAPAEQGTLEFRGMVTDDAGTAYGIFDTSTNKGRWVRAEDTSSPIRVMGFDAANSTLEVEQNGRPVKLSLKRSTILAGQPVTAMIPNVPAPNAAGNSGEVRRPEGAADARRLEAVAAEVRRRRALRNAARPPGQGQPPAVAPAPATPPTP